MPTKDEICVKVNKAGEELVKNGEHLHVKPSPARSAHVLLMAAWLTKKEED